MDAKNKTSESNESNLENQDIEIRRIVAEVNKEFYIELDVLRASQGLKTWRSLLEHLYKHYDSGKAA